MEMRGYGRLKHIASLALHSVTYNNREELWHELHKATTIAMQTEPIKWFYSFEHCCASLSRQGTAVPTIYLPCVIPYFLLAYSQSVYILTNLP